MADAGKIQAGLIIEILGKPAGHIKDALGGLIKKLGSEQGVKVIESKIHEPRLVKDSKEVYTTFAEVSVEFDSLANYFGVMFAYMPAHIEITSPEKFPLSNAELNELGNRLLARLHDYDGLTKKFIYERNFLAKKLQEVAPHLFKEQEEVQQTNKEIPKEKTKPKKQKKSKREKTN